MPLKVSGFLWIVFYIYARTKRAKSSGKWDVSESTKECLRPNLGGEIRCHVDQKEFFDLYYSSREQIDRIDKSYKEGRANFAVKYCNRGDLVLDVGAGNCEITRELEKRGILTIAVDVSRAGLVTGRGNGFRGELVVADARKLPFRLKKFNKVLCMELVEHLKDPDNLLKEVRRVLKPSGLAIMSTPNGERWLRRVARLVGVELKIGVTHVNEFGVNELSKLGLHAGLNTVDRGKLVLDIPYPLVAVLPSPILRKISGEFKKIPLFFCKFIASVFQKG